LVGSARPLKSIDVPGLSDIDEALGAIQRDALTIKISGPLDLLNERRFYQVIPFSSISQDMKNLLLGDAKGQQEQSGRYPG
jgi:hypothetical protein